MDCLSCGREFHDECDRPVSDSICCCNSSATDTKNVVEESRSKATKNTRRGDNVTVSAGRKRAAAEYLIDPGLPCEWRGKINCGGGFKAIPGCLAGFQTDRHHGPDKNTTNNSPENIHLICKPCHNLWHRRNDELYGPENKCPDGINLHEPRWATEDELLLLASRTKNAS